jgi:hypothetical protein
MPLPLILALAGLCLLFVRDCIVLSTAEAQPPVLEGGAHHALAQQAPAEQSGASLESALLDRLRLPSGRPLRHCARRRGGCEGYAHFLALAFREAGAAWEVDPWLLAAVATRESSLVEEAHGSAGERGIMQLHPRSPAGIRAHRECASAPSDCTTIEIALAAELLAHGVARCGSELAALGYYNSGRCNAESPYARSVIQRRADLRGAP